MEENYPRKMPLQLRPFNESDQLAAIALHHELKEDKFTFLLGWSEGSIWNGYLERLEKDARGEDLPEGRVPAALLAADVDGELVGRVSVRFALNEWLAHQGGHIGYAVGRNFRRRGYASEILRQALQIARHHGVTDALVCCDEDNVGSAGVIESCGGVLESIVEGWDPEGHAPPTLVKRYWIRGG
jgi:predicted acetyltransferase